MPATAPGSLTPEQAADIMAYMLSAGKYPAGTAPLDTKMETLLADQVRTGQVGAAPIGRRVQAARARRAACAARQTGLRRESAET